MNKGNILDIKLKKVGLRIHPKCKEELLEIYGRFHDRNLCISQYEARLRYMEDNIRTFRNRTKWYDPLKSNTKFNKIKFINAKEPNLRILFYVTDDNPTVVILLSAFEEKSGKNGRAIEYKDAAVIAESRLKEVLNG